MKLEVKRKMTNKELNNFNWHCAFCGKVVPADRKLIHTLYAKGEEPNMFLVCEYWCPNDGVNTRMEYRVGLKRVEKFLKEVNLYTVTRENK
jgi:hypothetical protein